MSSSLIGVVCLVLDVGERWEGACTQAIQLVLQEHHFLLLLLDYVEHATLMRNGHDLLAWVTGRVLVRSRLQVNNLLTLVNLHAQVASLAFKLGVLALLVLNLLEELLLLSSVGLQPVRRILLQLFNLFLESLFIVLILLLVLALDDLLGLLGDAVKLDVKGTGSVVINLEGLPLDDVFDLLQLRLVR